MTMLARRERTALRLLIDELIARGLPLRRALLFGSRARGDHDTRSDIDVLLVASIPERRKEAAAALAERVTGRAAARMRVPVECWLVADAELRSGRRTPMLVDALADALPIWPEGAPVPRLRFGRADARFCAARLLEWVEEGGPLVRGLLDTGEAAAAAARVRDDITRLATAALLLTGDTRHRRRGTLRLFARRFAGSRLVIEAMPALRWAEAAYPEDGGRGSERPPVTPAAIGTVREGARAAARFEAAAVPWIVARLQA